MCKPQFDTKLRHLDLVRVRLRRQLVAQVLLGLEAAPEDDLEVVRLVRVVHTDIKAAGGSGVCCHCAPNYSCSAANQRCATT